MSNTLCRTDINDNVSFEGIDKHISLVSQLALSLVSILVPLIMSVSTFKTVVVLYVSYNRNNYQY
jgi:hypothetical protein